MVKAYVCRAAEWVTREAMQLHGGMGYAEEFPVSRFFVDARVLSIFEGADETLCLRVIARRLAENALAHVLRPSQQLARNALARTRNVARSVGRARDERRGPGSSVARRARARAARSGTKGASSSTTRAGRVQAAAMTGRASAGASVHGFVRSTYRFVSPTRARIASVARLRSKRVERGVDLPSSVCEHAPSSGHASSAGIAPVHAVARGERHHPLHEVPDAVREVAVGRLDESLLGEVGLADTRHLARQPPAQRVGAVALDQFARVDRVPERLADLATAGGHVVVHEDLVGQRGRRPTAGSRARSPRGTEDALADDVPARRRPRSHRSKPGALT